METRGTAQDPRQDIHSALMSLRTRTWQWPMLRGTWYNFEWNLWRATPYSMPGLRDMVDRFKIAHEAKNHEGALDLAIKMKNQCWYFDFPRVPVKPIESARGLTMWFLVITLAWLSLPVPWDDPRGKDRPRQHREADCNWEPSLEAENKYQFRFAPKFNQTNQTEWKAKTGYPTKPDDLLATLDTLWADVQAQPLQPLLYSYLRDQVNAIKQWHRGNAAAFAQKQFPKDYSVWPPFKFKLPP
jgi:hypothetical protein